MIKIKTITIILWRKTKNIRKIRKNNKNKLKEKIKEKKSILIIIYVNTEYIDRYRRK